MHSAEESLHMVAATVGFLSFFLLWLAVVWGLVLRNGWALTWIRHSTLLGTHTTVALLGLTLGAVHATAQLAVPGGHVGVIDVLVPFTNYHDPIGLGVGVIGLEVMIAVALSIIFQRLLGYNRWRALHTLTYVAFTLVVAHILISGTDMEKPLAWGSVLGAWVFTVVLWLFTTPILVGLKKGAAERTSAKQRGQEISVNVNAQRCVRFGFCEHEAPDVFNLRGDGRLAYRASVTADEATAVIRAAEVCPARAITLTRVPMTVLTPRQADPPPDHPDPPPDRHPEHPGPVGVPTGTPGGGTVTGMRRRAQQRRGGRR